MSGRSWSQKLAAAATLLLALQAVAACNAVLGIEPAEEGDISAQVTECPEQQHFVPANTDCPTCKDDSQSTCHLAACLTDHDCRLGLRAYRNCLGSKCADTGGACEACVTNKQALTLIKCLAGQGCSAGAPTTVCEEYCSCMVQECADTIPVGAQATPAFDSCLDACQNGASPNWRTGLNDATDSGLWQSAQPSWRPYCLWEHCELAADQNGHNHCNHAAGKAGWCVTQPKEDTSTLRCPAGQNYGGFACNHDSECCSKHCDTGTLSCAN